MGAGAARRLSAVRWGVAGNMIVAWILTVPMAAAIGALAYGLTSLFGGGAIGPIIVSIISIILVTWLFLTRVRRGSPVTGESTA
jgi:PiT family inorganic phosphate transporter